MLSSYFFGYFDYYLIVCDVTSVVKHLLDYRV